MIVASVVLGIILLLAQIGYIYYLAIEEKTPVNTFDMNKRSYRVCICERRIFGVRVTRSLKFERKKQFEEWAEISIDTIQSINAGERFSLFAIGNGRLKLPRVKGDTTTQSIIINNNIVVRVDNLIMAFMYDRDDGLFRMVDFIQGSSLLNVVRVGNKKVLVAHHSHDEGVALNALRLSPNINRHMIGRGVSTCLSYSKKQESDKRGVPNEVIPWCQSKDGAYIYIRADVADILHINLDDDECFVVTNYSGKGSVIALDDIHIWIMVGQIICSIENNGSILVTDDFPSGQVKASVTLKRYLDRFHFYMYNINSVGSSLNERRVFMSTDGYVWKEGVWEEAILDVDEKDDFL